MDMKFRKKVRYEIIMSFKVECHITFTFFLCGFENKTGYHVYTHFPLSMFPACYIASSAYTHTAYLLLPLLEPDTCKGSHTVTLSWNIIVVFCWLSALDIARWLLRQRKL
jgi:hypothetical protein